MTEDRTGLVQSSRTVTAPERAPGGVEGESGQAELTVEQILAWADAHHAAHGTWPEVKLMQGAGPVSGAPGEWWKAINYALALGLRGLPGDSSLAELLAEHRGAPPPDMRPQALAEKIWVWEQEHFPIKQPRLRVRGGPYSCLLNPTQILAWADAHHAATREWPSPSAGPVRGATDGTTWSAVNTALKVGRRGLPGGSSLRRLLAEHRGAPVAWSKRPLSIEQILAWIDAHHAATGRWPKVASVAVAGAPGETWSAINNALWSGFRGLPGGSSLARLLAQKSDHKKKAAPPQLTTEQILAWADAHHAACGRWPGYGSGPVLSAAGETWQGIADALEHGHRGFIGGTTLAHILAAHRSAKQK